MNKVRHALFIAPSFAPASNPPTLRVRQFAKRLERFGWKPTIVSARPDRYEDAADPDMDALLPPGLRIVRSDAYPANLTRLVGIGDIGLRAYRPMRRTLRQLCAIDRPDVIIIPGPPWYTFRLGPSVARQWGIPYVLDYIDPWVAPSGAANRRWWTKAHWHHQLAQVLEPRAVLAAAHIVGVSQGTNDGVRDRYPALSADRFTAIPYGFEPDDFAAIDRRPRSRIRPAFWAADDGYVHCVSVGAMLPRGQDTVRALCAALARLRSHDPALGERIRLHFIGTTYDPRHPRPLVLPIAQAMGVADAVTERPARVPYLDALDILRRADAILVLGSSEPHYMASKTFPAIAARRPYLVCVHAASAACDVVRAAGDGILVTYDELRPATCHVSELVSALARLATPNALPTPRGFHSGLAAYSSDTMTARLAAVLDRVAVHRHGA